MTIERYEDTFFADGVRVSRRLVHMRCDRCPSLSMPMYDDSSVTDEDFRRLFTASGKNWRVYDGLDTCSLCRLLIDPDTRDLPIAQRVRASRASARLRELLLP